MKETIIVNKVEIKKKIINQFLIQGRKVEAVKFICEKANVGLATSKYIVDLFQNNTIDEFDDEDLFGKDEKELDELHVNRKPLLSSKTKKRLLIFCLLLFSGFLFLKYLIGFQHIGMHLETLKNSVLPSSYTLGDTSNDANAAIATDDLSQSTSNTMAALDAPESPLDTMMWESAIKNGDYIPEMVLEDVERYKNRDFSKLVAATDKPTDKQAEEAIARYYKAEVVSLLQQYKAHIKIGVCYEAPLQTVQDGDVEIARVTAMVSAFNKERGNLGNIQAPLDVIYDFVKYQSDPDSWYLADFSQSIPYDYKLNKDRW